MPNGKVNSKLTVNGADTPDVVAGGLDKEAAAVKNEKFQCNFGQGRNDRREQERCRGQLYGQDEHRSRGFRQDIGILSLSE